jgi:ABC-type uncharacterized transport system auxiliary subunit
MNQRPATLAAIPVLAGALLLAGCLTPKRHYPAVRHYTLTTAAPQTSATTTREPLLISPFTASILHNETTFLLRRGPNEVERDYYNRFAAPPAELLREQIATWLTTQGTFRDIRLTSVANEGLTMTGHLALIEADLTTRPPLARLELTLRLTQRDGRLIALQHGTSAIPVPNPTPEALASAWGTALTEILRNLDQTIQDAPND